MCIHTRSTSVCREDVQGSIGVALRSTRQSRRTYQAQMSRVLEDDVHRKKMAVGIILGTTKKLMHIQMYPTGRDRKDMLATPENIQQRFWEGIEAIKL